jgi:hypothetical protein
MNADDLARRYRRLLLTYPRSYRRANGTEIVTTLLDAAPAGRTRPTRAEAVDLILGGVRYRFRVRGPLAVVGAITATLIAAIAVGAFAAFAAWQTAEPLPPDGQAARMIRPLIPATVTPVSNREDVIFDDSPQFTDPRWVYLVGGTDNYHVGKVWYEFAEPSGGDDRAVVDRMRAALAADGWRLGPTHQWAPGVETVAYRGPYRMEITTADVDTAGDMRLTITRTVPGAVLPATTVGIGIGALAGWLFAAWAARTLRRGRGLLAAFAVVGFSLGVFGVLPATVMSAAGLVAGYQTPHDPVPVWGGYVFIFVRPLAYLGWLAIAGAAGLTALSGRFTRLLAGG